MNNLQQDGERGIDILHRSVALAAIHNSVESFPQPRCHPETRTGILKGLRGWALDGIDLGSDMDTEIGPFTFRLDGPADPECRILWVFGPAGAGKSAIMQTLAGQLQDAGQLGASFFFKRDHVTRGNARTLFATIAYQLALSVSCLRTSLSQTVENDPSIIVRSLEVQMQKLISEPLRDHGNRDSVTVIIDGLDECEGHQAQAEVLRTIKNLFSNNSIPLRFIIASRPEAHIREVLDSPPFLDVRRFNVEQSFDDVRKYLCDEFARIHREHRIMANVPSPWPTPDILDKLVWKSSGHFIYAATIIKFIDDKNYRPIQRLGIVQDNNTAGSASAFNALDQLYMAILGSVPRQAELAPILRAVANFALYLDQLDELLGLEDGEAVLLLRGLHSVLNVQSDEVRRPAHIKPPCFISGFP
ncbi:NACHT domain-containing protein [Mycena olivaceomarginata]|nr:NACHT domain-containing protein [Mycena olivaceomarginata]